MTDPFESEPEEDDLQAMWDVENDEAALDTPLGAKQREANAQEIIGIVEGWGK